jgi:hypothetical protein
MTEPRIACTVCGQDWLAPYRNILDGQQFLLCAECDSVWRPEDDTSKPTEHSLSNVFAGRRFLPGEVDWDFIERVVT